MVVPEAHPLLDAERLRVYPRILLCIYAALILLVGVTSHQMMDRFDKPIGYDFMAFWSASRLTLDGHGADVFDPAQISAAHRLAVPANERIFPWHYPPTYQLVVAPLALLPYLPSYLVFTAVTLALYLIAIRPLLPLPNAYLLLLAFPGAFLCAFQGQNSLLTAALMGAACACLGRRPVLAGIFFGLLAYKPQYGVLVPFVFAAAGQWRSFAAAALTVLVFAGLSTIAFGAALWQPFFADMAVTRHLIEQPTYPWAKMPSAFVFLCLLGASLQFAYAIHALVALGAVVVTVHVWRRCGPTRLAGATLISATLLLQPYIFDYEMAIVAVPLAILAGDMIERGARGWERAVLLFGFAFPLFLWPIAELVRLQIGFLALLLILFLCARRAPRAIPLKGHAAAFARAESTVD